MSNDSRNTVLNQKTSISVAIVLGLCGGAYWTGSAISELRVKVEVQQELTAKVSEMTLELKELSADNKRRLDLLEQSMK